MNTHCARANYIEDRSTNFKHHIPEDIAPVSAPTVQDYVYNEKSRQMNRLRDWYLDSKEAQTDVVSLRAKFANLRQFEGPSPVEELDHHKAFLLSGAFLAAVVGGFLLFIHF
jgi:hypothetical protein